MKKFLSLFLSLVMVLSLMVPTAFAAEEDITILYTNDVHTYIDNDENVGTDDDPSYEPRLRYSVVAALKDQLGANTLLVDAGDHIQGTAYGSMDKGKTIIDLMNAAGYDLATLGNHEFDYGQQGRINVTDNWAEFPYVSCNFYHETDGVPDKLVLDAYKIFTVGGWKIAFVGITTPESFTKSTPAYFQDDSGNYIYGIAGGADGEALYTYVQNAIDEAQAGGADIVVALGHLGDDSASDPWNSEDVIANTTGLDAFIDGHSHSTVAGKTVADKEGKDVLLTQTGEYLNAVGKMTIKADGTISTELLDYDDLKTLTPDDAVKAIEDGWIGEINTKLGEVIGKAEVTLNNYDADGNRLVRSQETNTGDFAADALYYLFDNMDMDVDMAIMNGGGVRNKATSGAISYRTCKDIHTFGNVACLQTITGQQLLDALEWGARFTTGDPASNVENGGFLQVAGLTYEIDASITSSVQFDEKGVWTGGPTGEYRVKNVQVYNKETQTYEDLDLEAKYNLAGYNFTLRDLGDGFAMFNGAVNVLDYVSEDYMVLANYVKAFESATIKADNSPLRTKYPNMLLDYSTVAGAGRIAITPRVPDPWDGVITIGGTELNVWFTKYGNTYCDCTVKHFTGTEDNGLGFQVGDIVTVKFLDQELQLPVVNNYSDVDSGKPCIRLGTNQHVEMAINMGNFGNTYGLVNITKNEDSTYSVTACDGVEFPVNVTFEMYEKGGYLAEYLLHQLERTNAREDYADLTDAEFANFRVIATTGMGQKVLYRGSSPINPEIGRNTYADAALKAAGVTVIMNLADSEEGAKAYPGFAESYYAGQKVIYLNLGVDFAADDFKAGLAKGLRFFADPAFKGETFYVHCTEGKDRCGFVSALLECLMGATYDEVVADYMVTYQNYYGVEPGSEQYAAIADSNIVKSLCRAFGVEDLSKADLQACAVKYIRSIGLSDTEIDSLQINLGKVVKSDDTPPATGDAFSVVYVGLMVAAACGTAVVVGRKKERF